MANLAQSVLPLLLCSAIGMIVWYISSLVVDRLTRRRMADNGTTNFIFGPLLGSFVDLAIARLLPISAHSAVPVLSALLFGTLLIPVVALICWALIRAWHYRT